MVGFTEELFRTEERGIGFNNQAQERERRGAQRKVWISYPLGAKWEWIKSERWKENRTMGVGVKDGWKGEGNGGWRKKMRTKEKQLKYPMGQSSAPLWQQ